MIDLARRSGQIQSIGAYVVHEADDFEYELGLHPDIHHKPSPLADRGPVTYVYAVAVLKGGGVQFEVMSRAEVEAIRKQSKAGNSGPWVTHWEEMARKSVVRKLFKYLPVSIEAVRAVEIDEKSDRGEIVTEEDFINGQYVEKGVSLNPVTPQEPPEEEAPAPVEQPAPEPVAAAEAEPAQAPAADPWLASFEQGTQNA